MKKFALFALLLIPAFGFSQRDNTFYAKAFFAKGGTVGSAVAAAQLSCIPDASIKCFIVIDSTLEAYAPGTLPTPCAQCVFEDFRSGMPGGSSGAPTNDVVAKRFHVQDAASTLDGAVVQATAESNGVSVVTASGYAFDMSVYNSATPYFEIPGVPGSTVASFLYGSVIEGMPLLSGGGGGVTALTLGTDPSGGDLSYFGALGYVLQTGNESFAILPPSSPSSSGQTYLQHLPEKSGIIAMLSDIPAIPAAQSYRSGISTSTAARQTVNYSDDGGSCFTAAPVVSLVGIGGSVNLASYDGATCSFIVNTAGCGFTWVVTQLTNSGSPE
jgi:hypothetical protein